MKNEHDFLFVRHKKVPIDSNDCYQIVKRNVHLLKHKYAFLPHECYSYNMYVPCNPPGFATEMKSALL
jgi:hypothetical protein